MKVKKSIILYAIVIIAILVLIFIGFKLFFQQNHEDFAKCLTEKKIVMYGSESCHACAAQKKMFGSSFQYINYTDCEAKTELCNEKGIIGYPTWEINGHLLEPGTMNLKTLGVVSGCQV